VCHWLAGTACARRDDVRTKSLTEVWRAILGTDINWDAPPLASLSPSALDFLKTLLRRKPEERPSASQVLQKI